VSLNWKEISLIIEELPLQGSLIQKVHQINFNTLVFELYHKERRFWELYVEVGTQNSRLHSLSKNIKQGRKRKMPKLQRFIQYMRAHVEGLRIREVTLPSCDRLVLLHLVGKEELILALRLFSGPHANIIVCDQNFVIKELLFRRPQRGDVAGEILSLPPQGEDDGRFTIRPYPEDQSFNSFIEHSYNTFKREVTEDLSTLIDRYINEKREHLETLIAQTMLQQKEGVKGESFKQKADLLSSYRHLLKEHQKSVTLEEQEITLNPALSIEENIAYYYAQSQKKRKAEQRKHDRLELLHTELNELDQQQKHFSHIELSGSNQEKRELIIQLKKEQSKEKETKAPQGKSIGLQFTSGIFTLLVGRNAKENDELLRTKVRGNDWWFHVRQGGGAYVFVKAISGKTLPLETMLDAGNLALLYSKQKSSSKADLYYTQVKYLRRAKGAKKGTVLPTSEKNLTISLDEKRIHRLFLTKEGE
jgi:predicted ribosome quality control (RQC) complex YloA/Tae2 family protein